MLQKTEAERFWEKVDRSEDGCWLWTASKVPAGYGMFHITRGKMMNSHRYAYEALVGPIPPKHELHHLCDERACVRPDHLKPLTRKEHMKEDGRHSRYSMGTRTA